MNNIDTILENQKEFYNSGSTKSLEFRKKSLMELKNAINEYEKEILLALKKDLCKSEFEAYVTEIGIVLEEINFMLKNMRKILRKKTVRTPLTQFPSKSTIYHEPYGNVLIMSPWNYPFQLALTPLVGAIACGNCAIIKPSNYSPETSGIINKIISKTFSKNYIAVIEGGRTVNQTLLDHKFDLIFFTGSSEVGKIVMEKAAKHLTPVVLELGGKSPCIVDETADIKLAGKRIAWGKCLNSGQTCVAPDYLLVHKSVKNQLITEIIKNTEIFYGKSPEKHSDFPKIINNKHFERLRHLIQSGDVIYGGGYNELTNKISLTLIDNVTWNDPVMQEELFGPILPIIEFESVDEFLPIINSRAKPLALYLFTKSKKMEKIIIDGVSYGGGCINDTIVHLATSYMGFGGVGESGMGSYHGAASIETFSHRKSIMKKSNLIDIPLRYPPYFNHLKLAKKIMK